MKKTEFQLKSNSSIKVMVPEEDVKNAENLIRILLSDRTERGSKLIRLDYEDYPYLVNADIFERAVRLNNPRNEILKSLKLQDEVCLRIFLFYSERKSEPAEEIINAIEILN
jgi:hypothetical protein